MRTLAVFAVCVFLLAVAVWVTSPGVRAVLLILVGFAFGRGYFGVIVLPTLYGIPRVLYHVSQGTLRLRAVVVYMTPVIVWSILFTVAFVVVSLVGGRSDPLYNSRDFAIGQFLGVISGVGQALTRQGRLDLTTDFWKAVDAYREPTPTSVVWRVVIRDVVLWSILIQVGRLILRAAGISGTSDSAWNSLFGCLGFVIVGCLTPSRRFRHLVFVALGVWLLNGLINVLVVRGSVSIRLWLLNLLLLLLIMTVGGALSFLFVRRAGSRLTP